VSRVLVLGASGMAGHVVATYLAEQGHDVTHVGGRNKLNEDTIKLDLTDRQRTDEFLDEHEFDVVVNCVGILIKQSDERPDLAAYLNGYLPHYLAQRFKDIPTKLIHLSTDCVFSGEHGPYREDSSYDGQTMYDRSKALGEIRNDKDLTLRMSIIGPELPAANGTGLFNWFWQQQGTIFGFTNATWNGITTIELAKGIAAAIDAGLTGLYHLTPATAIITKHDLVTLFKGVFGRDDITIEPKEAPLTTNKTLVHSRTDFAFAVSDYPAMVKEMKEWIDAHRELYPNYT
jgi:dTDP-4-dehydrorhamnose reductase